MSSDRRDAEKRRAEDDDIGAEHDERAMQHIDDIQHAPNQREADRQTGVNRTDQQAIDDVLGEHPYPASARTPARSPSRRTLAAPRTDRVIADAYVSRLDYCTPIASVPVFTEVRGKYLELPVLDLQDHRSRQRRFGRPH